MDMVITLVPQLSINQTITQEVIKEPATMDNLLTHNNHKEVKQADMVRVNREVDKVKVNREVDKVRVSKVEDMVTVNRLEDMLKVSSLEDRHSIVHNTVHTTTLTPNYMKLSYLKTKSK